MASAYGNEVTNRLASMFSPDNVVANQNRIRQVQEQNSLASIMQKHQGNVDAALPEIAQVSPEYAFKVDAMRKAQQAAQAQANKPVSMAAGGVLFDPVTRQPIFTAPTKPEKMPDWKDPAYLAYQRELERFKAGLRPANNQQKAPSGYRYTPDGNLEPIAGGPADIKAQMLAQQKGQASEQAALTSQQVLDQAAVLLNHPGRQAATGASYFMGNIPGTDAKGFQSQLETFKAQTFIPMVSALKGMGALSDAEGKKLAASVGALDQAMKEEEFKASLENIVNYLYAKGKASGLNVSNPLGQTAQQSSGTVTQQSPQNYDADKESRYQAWKAQQGR